MTNLDVMRMMSVVMMLMIEVNLLLLGWERQLCTHLFVGFSGGGTQNGAYREVRLEIGTLFAEKLGQPMTFDECGETTFWA